MRKTKRFYDYLFWYVLYGLPIILLIINWCCGQVNSLDTIFNNAGLSIIFDNIIFDTLVTLFGVDSTIMPVFANNDILQFLTYFIMLVIIHISVDVLLFIPRFCHKILDKGDD